MITTNLELSLATIPTIMQRGHHVLILIEVENEQLVLSQKKIYPAGIYRLIGGGVEPNETPLVAASRELQEEIQLAIEPTDLTPLAEVTSFITQQSTNQTYTLVTSIFYLKTTADQLHHPDSPDHELSSLHLVTKLELEKLINQYLHLPTSVDPELGFAWSDYGQLFGPLHQIALDEWEQLKEQPATS